MSSFIFKNCRIVTRNKIFDDHFVLVVDGRIQNVLPVGQAGSFLPDDAKVIDGSGRYLVPGFIDLHIHGAMNHLADWGPDELGKLCEVLPSFGVTGFLPTLTPPDREKETELFKAMASRSYAGATVLGFFLEGHYLALTGSLTNLPQDYSREGVCRLIDLFKPYSVIFGISPEIPGIFDLLPMMTKFGIPAFVTHTRATAKQAEQAILLGATHATHFYDVYPYPGDQEGGVRGCGVVEAFLAGDTTTVDFILDGEHVNPIAVKAALNALGPDRVCLITDANVNAGMPPGTYKSMGGQEITVAYEGAPARLGPNSHSPGGLNGSGLTLDRAVRNAVSMLNLPLTQAVSMASTNPARVLGLDRKKGLIAAGYDADLVLLDENLKVCASWVAGTQVYQGSSCYFTLEDYGRSCL